MTALMSERSELIMKKIFVVKITNICVFREQLYDFIVLEISQ